jgi:hypothetical protein
MNNSQQHLNYFKKGFLRDGWKVEENKGSITFSKPISREDRDAMIKASEQGQVDISGATSWWRRWLWPF